MHTFILVYALTITYLDHANIHSNNKCLLYKLEKSIPVGESKILLAASVKSCFMYSLVAPSSMVWSLTTNILQNYKYTCTFTTNILQKYK